MCSYQSNIRSLKTIETDQDRELYNGFSTQIPELNLLLWLHLELHLEKGNRKKLLQLNPQKGAGKRILADISGCHYGVNKECSLANSKDNKDFTVRQELLRQAWENLCPGFHDWFSCKRMQLVESNVIESTWKLTNVQGL